MSIPNRSVDKNEIGRLDSLVSSRELARLLIGLERQKEELGPIADELIALLHRLGVEGPPRQSDFVNPSSG